MKQFIKVVIWLVILVGVGIGVYTVLPEYPHNVVKSIVQPIVDSNAKSRISAVKALKNKDMDNVTYEAILTEKTHNTCWTYEAPDKSPDGFEHVYFYGRGVTVNLKDWSDYNGNISTSAMIKMDFKISSGNVDIIPYVDGKMMRIEDGKHVKENDKIKLDIFKQMYTGIKVDK